MEISVKERRYKQRKREIIGAAAKVFAQKGYHGASTKDIARVLGIQQGSLYHYITSKDAALEEVCWVGVEGFISGCKDILASQMTAPEKIRACVANHLLPIIDHQDFVIVFNNERQHLPNPMRRRVGKSSRLYETMVARIFSDGIADGELRADIDADLGARALLGLCNSATPWLKKPSQYSVDDVVNAFATILVSGVAATAPVPESL